MSLRRTQPMAFRPRGISDALESSQVFSGAMLALQDLIPDPSTKGLWQCRPAAVLIGDTAGTGAFSAGFSSGFTATTSAIPGPVGLISCFLIVGDLAYGLVGGAGNQDYPFAFNLRTNAFLPITGIVSSNLPNSPQASGEWTPPTMDVIGSTVLVTHPGFGGTANWIGWFDITVPAAPVWHAGNLGGPSGFVFSAATGVPVAVKAFNGRAYWAFNPSSGPSATVFSDVLAPLTVTDAGAVQIITYDDNVPITALGALPLSNQLGGIIQSLMVFKGVSNIYQITGDIALGPGPPLGTLARNTLNVATGTFSPNSLAVTTKGLAFIAPDGLRIIDFNAQVSDPIGNDGMGKTLPFLLALSPSRIAASANGTVYRVSVQDGSLVGSPQSEYWLDFSRGGIWSGPHSLPARLIRPYKTTFIMVPYVNSHALFRSDYSQNASSTFVENGVPMTVNWLTCLLPDTDQMCENAMIESTLYASLASGTAYTVHALDESKTVLDTVMIINPTAPTVWGAFFWGQADWGGTPAALFPQRMAWTRPIVFRRLALNVMGPANQQLRLGALHMRYEQLGYLQQPPSFMQQQVVPPPFTPLPPPAGPISSAGVFTVSSTRANSPGTLVRTLWSANTNDPRVSMDPRSWWDGTLDDGTVAPTGNYIISRLTNNVTYSWDGVVGNSSPDHTNISIGATPDAVGHFVFNGYHAYGGLIVDMAITAAGEMYYTTGYDERMNVIHVTTTSNPQYMNGVLGQGFRSTYTSSFYCCTDGINIYFNFFQAPFNLVWAVSCSTKTQVTFSGGIPSSGGITSVIGFSNTGQFILGIAVQQTGNQLFISRIETVTPATYSVWTLDKTTGATLHVNILGLVNQGGVCTNPVDGSLWLINTTSSPTADATFDTLFSNGVVLSNGNLTASSGSGFAPSTGSASKFYFEVVQDFNNGPVFDMPIGVCNSSGFTNNLGFDAAGNSAALYGGGAPIFKRAQIGTILVPFVAGDNIGVAVDIANGLIWWRTNGGTWNNISGADPATGTGGGSISGLTGPVFACVGFTQGTLSQGTAHFSSSSWTHAAPAGFGQLPGVNYSFNVTRFTSDPTTGVLTAGMNISGFLGAIAVGISPDGTTLLVTDGGASQQVKAFNTSDGSVKTAWGTSGTLGVAGGYATGPAVTNTKFQFQSMIGFSGGGAFVRYVPADGSFWLADPGNCRCLHFSAGNSPTYIEQIAFIPAFYACWVCYNDPTRVFVQYLEFKIDYTKPLAFGNGSSTLVNNWAHDTAFDQYGAMRYAITASNGRTYTPAQGGVIHELTSSGRRSTGVVANYAYIDRDFNLWNFPPAGPGQTAQWFVNRFTGFDGAGNPTWANDPSSLPPTLALTSHVLPALFPTLEPQNTTGNFVEALANGVIPIYDVNSDRGTNQNHLGGIDATSGAVRFSTHPPQPSLNAGSNANTFLEYPPNPVFPIQLPGTSVGPNGGGFMAYMPGSPDLFTAYRGEDWGSNQTLLWSHWHESGLLVNRVGVAAPYFGAFSSSNPFYTVHNRDLYFLPGGLPIVRDNGFYGYMGTWGLAGNVAWGGIAQVGSDYYLYNNDEWYHGGLHRWHVSNTSSTQVDSATIAWDASKFVAPQKIPYQFLSGLPFNTANIPTGTAGWVRDPLVDIVQDIFLTAPLFRLFTNAINCDPRGYPDLTFEANFPGPATASYSWSRTGTGSWTLTGGMFMPGGNVINTYDGGVPGSSTLLMDILDDTGKVLLRMDHAYRAGAAAPVTGESLFLNTAEGLSESTSHPIHTPFASGFWGGYARKTLPFVIHYDGHSMTVTYGDYTLSGLTSFDTGGNLAKPAQFRISYTSRSDLTPSYRGVSITALQFMDS